MITQFLADVRRNHALEHATVSLLLGRAGPDLRVVGHASNDGFLLYTDLPQSMLAECASDALARLQRGEAFWAVTPHCGTNIATAGILAGLASTLALGDGKRSDRLGTAMVACMAAFIIAQPLGRLIQRHITTSSDLGNTEIISIESRSRHLYKVHTRRLQPAAAGQVA